MELEIKNLGLTLAAGGLLLGGIYQILLWLEFTPFNFTLLGVDKSKPTENHGAGHGVEQNSKSGSSPGKVLEFLVGAIGLAMVFATGMLVEGFSQRLTASYDKSSYFSIAEHHLFPLVASDSSLRLHAFFETHPETDAKDTWILSYHDVAKDLIKSAANDELQNQHVSDLIAFLDQPGNLKVMGNTLQITNQADYNRCEDLVNQIFYTAKDKVYLNPNYFTELESFEMRKNFILAILFDFTILLFTHIIVWATQTWRILFAKKCNGKNKDAQKVKKYPLNPPLLLAGLLIYICASVIYEDANNRYNYRVYGYYATLASEPSDNSN